MDKKKNLLRVFFRVLTELIINLRLLSILLFIFTILSVLKEYLFLNLIEYITNKSGEMINISGNLFEAYIKKVITYVVIYFLLFLVGEFTSVVKVKYNAGIDRYVNEKLRCKLSEVCYENYESVTMSEKIKRVSENLAKGYGSAVESIVRIVELLLYIITYTVFLSKINLVFALTVIISIFVCGLLVTKMSSIQYKAFSDLTNTNQKRDYLNCLPIRKETHQEHQSNRLFSFIFRQYTKVYDKASKGYLKVHFYTILAESRALILFVIVIFLAYFYTINQVVSGEQEIGGFVTLIFIFGTLFNKASSLSYYISNRVTELLCVSEFYDLLNLEDDTSESPCINSNSSGVDIELKEVSYQYPQSDQLALDSISLKIKNREKIAIVGVNGSGKTTFSNILLGLLKNYEGEVRLGNQSCNKKYTIPTGYIKSMNQDFNIFQISLKENIEMGKDGLKSEMSGKELTAIIDTIGMREYIEKLPKGLKTKVGQLSDNGTELSYGQIQKIVAGRLLADESSNIWILDEPTAYLDPLAEIEMYDFFYQIGKNKSILFISHRLGFAKKADRILVFENGRIVENGTHNELMELNGVYTQLFLSQKQWYEEV